MKTLQDWEVDEIVDVLREFLFRTEEGDPALQAEIQSVLDLLETEHNTDE